MESGELKWLKPWLQLPFYKEKCTNLVHENKYKTIYCTDCMEPPMCKLCLGKKLSQHQDHQILQVCIASRRPAICVKEIRKCLDVSHIQEYTINDKKVVYLNPCEREKETLNQIHKPICKVCKGNLIDSYNTFCSIACKITTMNMEVDMKSDLPIVKESESKPIVEENNAQILPKGGSFRKRSRKGIPIRSPLS